jgi:hypothetical protein
LVSLNRQGFLDSWLILRPCGFVGTIFVKNSSPLAYFTIVASVFKLPASALVNIETPMFIIAVRFHIFLLVCVFRPSRMARTISPENNIGRSFMPPLRAIAVARIDPA